MKRNIECLKSTLLREYKSETTTAKRVCVSQVEKSKRKKAESLAEKKKQFHAHCQFNSPWLSSIYSLYNNNMSLSKKEVTFRGFKKVKKIYYVILNETNVTLNWVNIIKIKKILFYIAINNLSKQKITILQHTMYGKVKIARILL